MIPIALDINERFEVVAVNGSPYLFTNLRIDRNTIPESLTAYDVMDADCDGEFYMIARYVFVNHWGTIIGKEPVMPTDGKYFCYEEDGNFIGECCNIKEYLDSYAELKERSRA